MARAWFRKVFNGLFFLLLGSLPILVLLGGWRFTAERQEFFDNLDQERTAAEIHDALALGWEPREQLKLRGGAFLRSVLGPGKSGTFNGKAIRWARQTFGIFPGGLTFLFRIPAIGNPAGFELISAPDLLPEGRKGFGIIFSFLVRRNAGKLQDPTEASLATKMLKKFFGENILPDLMGDFLRGLPVRVIFRGRYHWLAWDHRFSHKMGGLGYLILVPDEPHLREAAFRLALENALRGRRAFAAFAAYFPSAVPNILSRGLERSKSFRLWVEAFQPHRRHLSLERADFSTHPWRSTVGEWDLSTRAIPNSTHLSVVLLPRRAPLSSPITSMEMISVTVFLLGSAFLFLHGRGRFPGIRFQSRFALVFSLAFGLPLSLAVSACAIYRSERGRTLSENLKKRLQTEIERMESRQAAFRNRYQAAFSRISANGEIRELLSQNGLKKTRTGEKLLKIAMGCLEDAGLKLPVSHLEFIDAEGHSLATSSDVPIRRAEGLEVRFLRATLITTLRDRYREVHKSEPPGENPVPAEDRKIVKGFVRFTGMRSISLHTEERLGSIQVLTSGKSPTFQFFNLLPVAGREPVAFMVLWKPGKLRYEMIDSALAEFNRRNPDLKAFLGGHLRRPELRHRPSRETVSVLKMARYGSRLRQVDGGDSLLLAKISSAMFHQVIGIQAPLEPIRRELRLLTDILVGLPLLGFLIATAFGIFAWHRIGIPLINLKEAMAAVLEGKLPERIGVSRADEIGLLTRSFDHMTDGLALRARFAPLVSGKALDALSRHESPAKAVAGRSAKIVAMVSDIRDFTTLCESKPIDQITGLLNRHFQEMSVIIDGFGGQVDRFIGDAILAVFEEPLQSSGEAPVRAGIAMLERLSELNREREAAGSFPYRIGIGLAAGKVVIGGVGDPSIRFDFAVIGTPMKRAVVLEAMSKGVSHFPLVSDERTMELSGVLGSTMAPHPDDPTAFFFPAGSIPPGSRK